MRSATNVSGRVHLAVAIPTRNRPDDLEKTVRTVLRQTVLPDQLIIVDQSTTLESHGRVLEQYREAPEASQARVELTYLRNPELTGLTEARNYSLASCRGDILLFLDDDVTLEPRFIECLLRAYERSPEATGISGIITNYTPPPFFFRLWELIFEHGPFHDDRQPVYWQAHSLVGSQPVRVSRLGGGLMSFRVNAIQNVRFDSRLSGACEGEDVDFCMRLPQGAVLLIAPDARLEHSQSPAGRSGDHWLYRHARTAWYLYRKNWNRGVSNPLFLAWLNVGYSVAAVATALRRRSAEPIAELRKAVCDSRTLAGPV